MKHTITNTFFNVSVLSKGAEISCISSVKTGEEYMWDADPEIWGSHSPVLFPAIGSFKDNKCIINGVTYAMPKHGFIRNNQNLLLIEKTKTKLKFQLNYSKETLRMYPFKFRFFISFELIKNKLVVSHKVENCDKKEIFFSLGAHPAFKCPLYKEETYNDYYLEFEKEENASSIVLSKNGLITDHTTQILEETNILPLHNALFKNDALIFKTLNSRKVHLKSKKSDYCLTIDYHDFPTLALWAKPNAPFICIEPWIGTADHENSDGHFLTKDGLITLSKGGLFTADYSIGIAEPSN
jgi:galactose mutarotase-like enzyme